MTRALKACLAAGMLTLSLPASAQTLRMAVAAPPNSIDPMFHTLTPNNAIAMHIFDSLVQRDENSRLIPGLAESWTQVGEKTWEFKLRKGVKFHDGTDFTAEDVEFSLNRIPNVPNSPSSFAVYTKSIDRVETVDPHTMRFHSKEPAPLLPTDFSSFFIISKSVEANSATSDFNSGKAAIGTGPYRFVSYTPGDRLELERFAAYYGAKPHWEKVTYRFIPNEGARVASLLSGDVQFIDQVPASEIERLRKDKRISIAEAVSLRLIYLGLDVASADSSPQVAGPNGEKLTRNPLHDPRVRHALSLGINRQAISERLLEGVGVPTVQFMPEGAFGYNPELRTRPYDPEGAKLLLAEAGYPKGFTITISGPNDRYIKDANIIQAVGQMWSRIGVKTRVEPAPYASFVTRAAKFEFSSYLGGWSNGSGEPSNGYKAVIATRDPAKGWGLSNRGRYSNPALDKGLAEALVTVDEKAREAKFKDVAVLLEKDMPVIPLHHQKAVWGMSSDLKYVSRIDEVTFIPAITPAR